MKVLHVSTSMNRRGGDVQLLTTIELFKGSTDIQHLVLCARNSPLAALCEEKNIPFIVANRKALLSYDYIQKLTSLARHEKMDIVHVHDSKAHQLALLVNMWVSLKIVYSKKRDNPVPNTYWRRLKYNHSSIVKIICLSESIKNTFNGILASPEKAVVIYDGIDVDYYAVQSNTHILHQEFNLSEDTLIIGNAGALVGQKDFFTFLAAAQIILAKTKRKVIFVILGEGKYLAQLQAFSVELGIAEKVIFAGFRSDFAQLLPEFHILMMSSMSEGLPLTLLSAMAARVPVVTTAAGGIGEVMLHHQTGMISPIKNPQQLAENALLVLEDEALRESLSTQASLLILEKFTLDAMQKKYLSFYQEIIA